jgi:type IV secretion system protein VirB9
MTRKVSFAALAVLCCSAAHAAADNRVRTLAYEPDQIVRILGKAGIQSTIEFADDERIENVAVGDSSAWQITPNRRASLLFVKPLAARSRTNMTVVTDRRTYMFDLVAGDKWTTPVYALKFSYPNEKPAEPPKPAQPTVTVAASAAATMTADKLHFDWNTKGYGKLLPARVFDDGSSVYLSWSRDIPLPAILTVSDDRREGPVNYRMSGEYIVVSPVPANLLLRYGNKSAILWPTHKRSAPAPTISPNAIAGQMASTPVTQSLAMPVQAAPMQPLPQQNVAAPAGSVKLANMTALYSDKLTDADHEH